MLDDKLESQDEIPTVGTAPEQPHENGPAESDRAIAAGPSSMSEEQELAASLAAILARKPRRPATKPPAGIGAVPDDADIGDSETAIVSPTARRAFVSALRHQASSAREPVSASAGEDGTPGDDTVPHDTGKWLAASRRRSVRRTLKAAGAWVATIAIGSAIVLVAAIVLFEGPRDLEAWLDLAYRTL